MTLVLLDSGPLGVLVHRRDDVRTPAERWLTRLAERHIPVLPEIAWFELRRELLRLGLMSSVRNLDGPRTQMRYAPVTSSILRRASELWAETRRGGRPTTDDKSLDIDVILAATALDLGTATRDEIIVATANLRHLSQFVDARLWQSI